MTTNDFIFSRITIVLIIIMILSIPTLNTWPLFHVKAVKDFSIVRDSIDTKDGEKFHSVWINTNDKLRHEKYYISSKREMSLYDKLRNDGIYMEESIVLEVIYVILWFLTMFCAFYCLLEGLFIADLYDSEKEKLAEFYVKIIKKILKFLGHDPEKVENLELTIQYDKRLYFIGCFIKLAQNVLNK